MIGADKFFSFLEPPCSLQNNISPMIWQLFGLIQIEAGILIWVPKFRKYIAGFFAAYMLIFTLIHLWNNTYDVGGSVFMAILLLLLVWNPSFIRGKK
jgi:uncharacterized membrane protein YphA (DoxX/SURF4 family)